MASGPIVALAPGLDREPGCQVELTEIRTGGQDWWSLGFEATGPADLLRSELEAAAELVFAEDLPGELELGPVESRSYAEWLDGRPLTAPAAPDDPAGGSAVGSGGAGVAFRGPVA
jgi:hypothetical protein